MSTTIKNMTKISIESEFFSEEAFLEFFPHDHESNKTNRVALVYGKNGSGKSTIADGIRDYKNSNNDNGINLEIYDKANIILETDKRERENINVFDEKYISSRIMIKEDGLNTIVLFGKQVDLEKKIVEIEKKVNEINEIIKNLDEEYNKYLDEKNILSPDYSYNKILNTLKKPEGWAEIGSKIKEHKRNLSVTDDVIVRLGELHINKPISDLEDNFNEIYKQFTSIDVKSNAFINEVMSIVFNDNIDVESKKILMQKIAKPELTNREERILSLFGIEKVNNAREYISNNSVITCDRCFQKIDDEYRTNTLKEIDNILNHEIEEFREKAKKLIIEEVNKDIYLQYSNLESYSEVIKYIEEYNAIIRMHNTMILEKIENPFDSIEHNESIKNMEEACKIANEALANLEFERKGYNRIIQKRAIVEKELLDLNDEIASYSIKDFYNEYKEQKSKKEEIEFEIEYKTQIVAELESQKNMLNLQRSNFEIAEKEINRSLQYVFFNKNRLSIELGKDKLYRVKVNNIFVSPNKVSSGERNALALCYFFTEIAERMDEKNIYSDEMLLVIDDPISSFDTDNRVGIISLLRWKLKLVLESCNKSKVIIMTHDISVIYNLEKVIREIAKYCEKKSVFSSMFTFQLENKSLLKLNHNKYNVYNQLLKCIYTYAAGSNSDEILDISIGNIMRRALEAFSTFTFRIGVNDLSLNENVLRLLPDEQTKEYYNNLMYRLVLNDESHFEDRIKSDVELGFFNYLSQSEKQQTAKDILCFIYYLNKTHLLSHIPEATSDLERWIKRGE